MNIKKDQRPDNTVLKIGGDLTFETIGEFRSAYLDVAGVPNLEIFFSDLQNIDLAGLQILYSIQKDRESTAGGLRFSGEKGLQRLGRMAEFAGIPPLKGNDA